MSPYDQPCRIATGAVFLVSWDKHIKNLGDLNHPEGQRFRVNHPQVTVVDPQQFLQRYYSEWERGIRR